MDSQRINRALDEVSRKFVRRAGGGDAQHTTGRPAGDTQPPPPNSSTEKITLRQFLKTRFVDVNNMDAIAMAKLLFQSTTSATDKSNIWEKALTDTPIKHSYALAVNYNALLQKQIKSEYRQTNNSFFYYTN